MISLNSPLRITLLYVVCATAWIWFTDVLLFNMTKDSFLLNGFQHLKGMGFVIFTAMILQGLLVKYQHARDTERHTQQELGDAYRTLFQESYSVMLLVDPDDGTIVDANIAAVRFYGYDLDSLRKMKITAINMLTDEDAHHKAHVTHHQQRNCIRFRHQLATGAVRDVEVYSGPIQMHGRVLFHSIVHDVSERIRREHERNGLLRLASALRQAETKEEILPVLLDQTLAILGSHSAILWRGKPADERAFADLGRGVWAGFQGQSISLDATITGQVLRSGVPRNVANMASEPRFYHGHLFGPDAAAMCALLINQDEPIGVMWVARDTPFSDDDVAALMAIADMGANALHRAALHAQTIRRLERIEGLAQIDRAIMLSHGHTPALETLLEVVTTQLHADASVVLLCAPGQPHLQCAAARGLVSATCERIAALVPVELAEHVCASPTPSDLHLDYAPLLSTVLAEDGLSYGYAAPLVVDDRSIGVLNVFLKSPEVINDEWCAFLKTLAGQAALAIDRARLYTNLEQTALDLERAYDETLAGWAKALELRDAETEGHSQRVVSLAVRLAQELGLSEAELSNVRRGALLHDVGKMGVPDAILNKPGRLTANEFEVIKHHPVYAYNWLRQISYLQPVLDIPYSHHERWDGQGYPQQLKGEAIPLAARLFTIVDVWDALTSDRPYRAAWSPERTRAYIAEQAGTQFDPALVPVFLRLVGG
ncbi:MAG: GAF domain-containing protein [Candidatus Viridilinea halotolerans]|uniref:GAF domain-containing protein n=1 Tax=Candidatus Viridilinea halotolerans TaxID=2491704 RepID=A0A426TTM5_9CHLR|nr:MAG: GAF domain-containing protein [Candidatus Viridilinea halotolerans]